MSDLTKQQKRLLLTILEQDNWKIERYEDLDETDTEELRRLNSFCGMYNKINIFISQWYLDKCLYD